MHPDCHRDPPRMRPARVRPRTGDRSMRVDQPLGEPGNPLDDGALEARLAMLCAHRVDDRLVREVIAAAWAVDDPAARSRSLRLPEPA